MSDRSCHELELCHSACCLLHLLENVFLFERGTLILDFFFQQSVCPGVALSKVRFRYTFYRPQTKRLRARNIGLQYKILLLGTSCLGRPPGDGLRSPFGRRAMRQRGYGLRLLIFKSRSGSDKKRRNRLR